MNTIEEITFNEMEEDSDHFMKEYARLKIDFDIVANILEREVGFMRDYTSDSVISDKDIEPWKKRIILGRINKFILNMNRLIENI